MTEQSPPARSETQISFCTALARGGPKNDTTFFFLLSLHFESIFLVHHDLMLHRTALRLIVSFAPTLGCRSSPLSPLLSSSLLRPRSPCLLSPYIIFLDFYCAKDRVQFQTEIDTTNMFGQTSWWHAKACYPTFRGASSSARPPWTTTLPHQMSCYSSRSRPIQ